MLAEKGFGLSRIADGVNMSAEQIERLLLEPQASPMFALDLQS